MTHRLQYLEERLHALEDTQRRCAGEPSPSVCGACYSIRDNTDGCLCDERSWVLLGVAIVELRLTVDGMYQRLWEAERAAADGEHFQLEKYAPAL